MNTELPEDSVTVVSVADHWYDSCGRLRITTIYEREAVYEMEIPGDEGEHVRWWGSNKSPSWRLLPGGATPPLGLVD